MAVGGRERVTVRVGNRRIPVPRSRAVRVLLGSSLVTVGIVGIPFPIVGLWMVPPGLILLSKDSHRVRRLRRRGEVWALRRWRRQGAKQTGTGPADPLASAN